MQTCAHAWLACLLQSGEGLLRGRATACGMHPQTPTAVSHVSRLSKRFKTEHLRCHGPRWPPLTPQGTCTCKQNQFVHP